MVSGLLGEFLIAKGYPASDFCEIRRLRDHEKVVFSGGSGNFRQLRYMLRSRI